MFEKKSIALSIKHLPIDFLLYRLLKERNARKKTTIYAESITSQHKVYFHFDHARHILAFDLIDSYDLFQNGVTCIIGDGHCGSEKGEEGRCD